MCDSSDYIPAARRSDGASGDTQFMIWPEAPVPTWTGLRPCSSNADAGFLPDRASSRTMEDFICCNGAALASYAIYAKLHR